MQVTKTETQLREVEVTIERYTLCDKCNTKIRLVNYDAFKCEFTHKTGDAFLDSGGGDLQQMELCPKCAVELVSLLRENGYRINDSEWEY
jgi:uncharacterized protein with PIN domain